MSSSDEQILLSELLIATDNCLLPKQLEELCNYAAEVQKVEKPTNFEKNWLIDFNLNIGIAVMNSHKLDIKVQDRINPGTSKNDDYSKPKKNQNIVGEERALVALEEQYESVNQYEQVVENGQEESLKNLVNIEKKDEVEKDFKQKEEIFKNISIDLTKKVESKFEQEYTSTPKSPPKIKPVEINNNFSKRDNFWGSEFTPSPVTKETRPVTETKRNVPKIKLNELVNKPSHFDGDRRKARRWIEDYEICSLNNGWDNETMAYYFSAFLNSHSRDWYNNVALPTIRSNVDWFSLKTIFLRSYIGPDAIQNLKEEFQRIRQKREEPIMEFIPRVLRLMRLVDPNQEEVERVKDIKVRLLDEFQDRLIGKNPTSLLELNDICLEIEDRLIISKNNKNKFKKFQNKNEKGNAETSKNFYQKDNIKNKIKTDKLIDKREKTLHCSRCDRNGHVKDKCFAKTRLD